MKTSGQLLVAALILVLIGAASAGPADIDPYRLDELAKLPLDVKVIKDTVTDGIRVMHVRFTSEVYEGRPVRIFGIYAVGAAVEGKVPGVLWTQSGLARASEHFPMLLARRGYGCLCIDAPFRGYRSTGVAGLDVWHIGDPIGKHSAVRLARALHRGVTFLASRPEIDSARIGAAGSSWGGYSSFLVAGLDARVRVASTFFGCGNLQLGSAWDRELGKLPAGQLERWRRLYDPAARLPERRDLAVMITTGTNDHFYRVPAVSKTYLDARGDKRLGWFPHWNHGLPPRGDEMVFEFLDHHLQLGKSVPFNRITGAKIANRNGQLVVAFKSSGARKLRSAAAHFSYGPEGNWVGRLWAQAPADLKDGAYEAAIPVIEPAIPIVWYAGIDDVSGARIGTDARVVTPEKLGIVAPTAQSFEAEGCVFGDFEAEDMAYLRGMGQRVAPTDRNNPHTGEQCLKLVANKGEVEFSTDYLRWCPAFQSELSAWIRGTGARATLSIRGTANGRDVVYSTDATAGEQWQRIAVHVPAFKPGTSGRLTFYLRVPKGQTVWVDTVSFKPDLKKHTTEHAQR